MAEFSIIEQQMLTKGMTPEQQMLFASHYASVSKDRSVALIISVILGVWGIDRFYLGDIGLGLLKLFTAGGCGVLWLVDIFLISGRADDINRGKAAEIAQAIKLTAQ
jgi:TM2 domain-containing membrane protein YozV